jgi:hypothetical protein
MEDPRRRVFGRLDHRGRRGGCGFVEPDGARIVELDLHEHDNAAIHHAQIAGVRLLKARDTPREAERMLVCVEVVAGDLRVHGAFQ